MLWIIIGLLFLVFAWIGTRFVPTGIFPPFVLAALRWSSVAVALFSLGLTSWVTVGADEVGHLKRIYGYEDLPKGQILARDESQKGPQARILGPGFHFIPFIRVLYSIEYAPVVEVPAGSYASLVARDGTPMPTGMFIAPDFENVGHEVSQMLDARYFLENGGIKGPQLTVLPPGRYRLNRYLFEVKIEGNAATVIPAGHVGVVKSNVRWANVNNCASIDVSDHYGFEVEGALAVPLVPTGCIGVWDEPLYPGAYYLNERAYDVSVVDTRAQTWRYEGGYISKSISLKVDQNGQIEQVPTEIQIPVPDGAADRAIDVKIEGWTIFQNLRAVVQVRPQMAPVVVASVGSLDDVEDKILTPTIQSIVRSVLGGTKPVIPAPNENDSDALRPIVVLDAVEQREYLESLVENDIIREGRKAGVDITEVRFGNPDIPPELLVARKREQLATQLSRAYRTEEAAQERRIQTEQARATADQQASLVTSQIAVQKADLYQEERQKRGAADRAYLEEVALGQQAQSEVLGPDRVLTIQLFERLLEALRERPEILTGIKLPGTVVVNGNGSGGLNLEGAMAVLRSTSIPDTKEK